MRRASGYSGKTSTSCNECNPTETEFRVCVLCASSNETDPIFLEVAKGLAQAIAERRWRRVFGGAEVGLMGAMAADVKAACDTMARFWHDGVKLYPAHIRL